MSPKRNERVAPPGKPDGWEMRYLRAEAIRGWEELCRNAAGPTRSAWDAITESPMEQSSPHRQHQLKGKLAYLQVGSAELEQWQYEVTYSGRIWYCPDPDKMIIWLVHASTGHPKKTD